MYTIKSSKAGKPTEVETIPEVIREIERILRSREGGMRYGKIIIERK